MKLPGSNLYLRSAIMRPRVRLLKTKKLRPRTKQTAAFTIVEALIALTVLTIFLLTSTMALNLFDAGR